ncbi:hypothetical protein Tco_1462937 [Tanacetum coccineum]
MSSISTNSSSPMLILVLGSPGVILNSSLSSANSDGESEIISWLSYLGDRKAESPDEVLFRSLQLFVHSVDVLSNHLLAIPSSVRGNTCTRVDSWALNMLAISSTLLMCSIALSVGLPEKETLRNSLRIFPLISNVESSGQVNLLLVLF